MSDNVTRAGESFPQTVGSWKDQRAHLSSVLAQYEDARLAKFLPYVVPAVCEEFELSREAIFSTTRTRRITVPRHVCWFLCVYHPAARFAYARIGPAFGRDHTTVFNGVKVVRERLIRNEKSVLTKTQKVCNRLSFHGLKDWKVTL